MAVTQTVKIEMLEKLADGNYKLKYPKTTQDQVVGLETALKILTQLKTVDSDTNGLNASTLQGNTASDFQSANKIYGNIILTDSIAQGAVLTKNIPLGSTYKHGKLIIGNSSATNGILVFFSNDNLKTLVAGSASPTAFAWSRRMVGCITEQTKYGVGITGQTWIGIDDIYINGSNLVVIFRNRGTTGAYTLNCVIDWEVW